MLIWPRVKRFRLVLGRLSFLSSLILLLLLVACSPAGGIGNAESLDPALDTPAVSSSTVVPAVGSEDLLESTEMPPAVTVSDTVEDRPVSWMIGDFDQMLVALGSYQNDVSVSFEGQDAGGLPVAFLWRSLSTFALDGPGYVLELSATGDEQPDGVQSMSLVRTAERSYLHLPGIGCVSGMADDFADDMALPLNPADLLNGLSASELVSKGAVVNGLVTTEFSFDQEALDWSAAGPWLVEGVAYVAEDSGLLTRSEMTIVGQGDLMGDGRVLDGLYEVRVDVQDLDDSLTVGVPEECLQAHRYPVTEDAFDLSAIDDLLAFSSLMPLAKVVEYYLAEMPIAGWQLLTEPDVIEDLAFLTFERDGEQLTITIEYDTASDGVSVLISP